MSEYGFVRNLQREEGDVRKQCLDAMLQVVDTFVTDYQEDARGRDVRVDKELREGLAVLLSMGINTQSSCWGHPERRDQVTSANIGWPEYQLVPQILIEAVHPIDIAMQDDKETFSDEEWTKILERASQQRELLEQYLQEFSVQRGSPLQYIMLNTYNPGLSFFFLTTKNRDGITDMARAEQDILIAGAQQEWAGFLSFLKQKYLSDHSKKFVPVKYPEAK